MNNRSPDGLSDDEVVLSSEVKTALYVMLHQTLAQAGFGVLLQNYQMVPVAEGYSELEGDDPDFDGPAYGSMVQFKANAPYAPDFMPDHRQMLQLNERIAPLGVRAVKTVTNAGENALLFKFSKRVADGQLDTYKGSLN